MAQNVTINGVTYPDVPEVNIPQEGGGTARFIDTSDATLSSASQLPNGVSAYGPEGKVAGSAANRTSSDLTQTGATVTAPAGFYAQAASKSVPSGSAATPATTIDADPTITVGANGKITAEVSKSQSVTPSVTAGYVSAGTAGNVTVTGSAEEQLPVKAAASILPSSADQTIASGQYLTGTQTIKAVTVKNLQPGYIAQGIVVEVGCEDDSDSVVKVTGTLSSVTVTQDSQTKILTIA